MVCVCVCVNSTVDRKMGQKWCVRGKHTQRMGVQERRINSGFAVIFETTVA